MWGLTNGFSGRRGYLLQGLVMGFFFAMSDMGGGMEQDMKIIRNRVLKAKSKTKTKTKTRTKT
jgi:hypothetical protein